MVMSEQPGKHSELPLHGITIWLDSYDDLFSDFDPREYDHRSLSDDFLSEVRKIIREDDEPHDNQELHLLIPANIRNSKTEELITHRLHSYFRSNAQSIKKEISEIWRRGILVSVTGAFFLLCAGYISWLHPAILPLHFLMVTLEPAGWFFIWNGYDNIVNVMRRKNPDLSFNLKMTRNKILFKSL